MIKIGKALSFQEMIEQYKAKVEETHRQYLKTGLCSHCGKRKATYPDGINPYLCSICNEETARLIRELRKDPSFVG